MSDKELTLTFTLGTTVKFPHSEVPFSRVQLSGMGVTPVPLGTTVPGQTTAPNGLVTNPDTTAATLRKGQTAGQIAAANPQGNVFNPTAETAATNPGEHPRFFQPPSPQTLDREGWAMERQGTWGYHAPGTCPMDPSHELT